MELAASFILSWASFCHCWADWLQCRMVSSGKMGFFIASCTALCGLLAQFVQMRRIVQLVILALADAR